MSSAELDKVIDDVVSLFGSWGLRLDEGEEAISKIGAFVHEHTS